VPNLFNASMLPYLLFLVEYKLTPFLYSSFDLNVDILDFTFAKASFAWGDLLTLIPALVEFNTYY
jgi:hypothetical protein